MEYIISDTHVDHFNIIRLSKRPFESVEEMNSTIINNINRVVKTGDTLYHLGDAAWKHSHLYEHLNCQNIHRFQGNHDPKGSGIPYLEINSYGHHIVLCHYPLESWNRKGRGSIHLHGHTHNMLPSIGIRRLDVGVDSIGFSPIPLKEAIDKAIANGGTDYKRYP